ncbi:phosphatase PAP2 family protein [Rhodoferax mekongensis]|uniref:Phosphatase PAP2 family protein n=1 Tax=Rhodoferax mekongensis TaxID=3068341 RepID=A0ABZ0B1A7_9BURK|nr:phosphatase PAP2 family protein [Rhodoferax sp. TBRC 17307]WNO05683.1 phosphatase PAP2 family protein [Rhodoferax sp. TBRC 17307]
MLMPRPVTPHALASPVSASSWWWPLVIFVLGTPLWLQLWEPTLFITINQWCAPLAAEFWTGLSLLGNGWGLLAVTAPLLVFAPRLMVAWLCAAPFAVLFARTGKFFIESPRPAAVVDNAQMRVVGELLHNVSMPSGHTLTAFAVASGIYYALTVAQRRRHWWLLVLAAGTGLSRIAVGAHWPGDVAVGASLGLLAGLLGHQVWIRLPSTQFAPTAWGVRIAAVLVALSIFHLVTEDLDFAENHRAQMVLTVVAVTSLLIYLWRLLASTFQKK